MAKINRFHQKIFAENAPGSGAGGVGKFGSLAAGTPTLSTDPATIMSLSNFSDGWLSAIIGNNSPAIEDMNALFYVITRQLAYLLQAGIAEWDPTTAYYSNSSVMHQGVVYISKTNNNVGNNPFDDVSEVNWKLFSSIRPGAMMVWADNHLVGIPRGWLHCNGTEISRTTYADLFNATTYQITGNTVSGSTTVTGLSDASPGWGAPNITYISGAGIPVAAIVQSVTGTQLTLNSPATATANNVPLTLGFWRLGDGSTTFTLPDKALMFIRGIGDGENEPYIIKI